MSLHIPFAEGFEEDAGAVGFGAQLIEAACLGGVIHKLPFGLEQGVLHGCLLLPYFAALPTLLLSTLASLLLSTLLSEIEITEERGGADRVGFRGGLGDGVRAAMFARKSLGHSGFEPRKAQTAEDGEEPVGVRVAALQTAEVDVGGNVGAYSGHELGMTYQLGVLLDLAAQRPLELVGMLEQILHRAELLNELHGSFLAHTRAAGNIVYLIAHECQQVNDLSCG